MANWELIAIFVGSAIITWIAGVWLTRAADALDTKYKLGSAFGGLLILGVATSLPEVAVAVSAALAHHYDIIIGTLVGGIAIQTMILSLLDARMHLRAPLTFAAASLTLVLEATIVILVAVASIIAIRTPILLPGTPISLASLFIFLLWLIGLWLAYRARKGLPWRTEAIAAAPGREHHERQAVINHPTLRGATNFKIWSILLVSAIAILFAGIGLQSAGNNLAVTYGIGSGLFGATFIALAAALPDFSTGFTSIAIGDYKLAMSDIFGGNSFMPALFLVSDLIAGKAVLTHASATDIWFAALGALLTGIYIIGLITRPRRLYLRMGLDSLAVLVLYIIGIIVLAVTGG